MPATMVTRRRQHVRTSADMSASNMHSSVSTVVEQRRQPFGQVSHLISPRMLAHFTSSIGRLQISQHVAHSAIRHQRGLPELTSLSFGLATCEAYLSPTLIRPPQREQMCVRRAVRTVVWITSASPPSCTDPCLRRPPCPAPERTPGAAPVCTRSSTSSRDAGRCRTANIGGSTAASEATSESGAGRSEAPRCAGTSGRLAAAHRAHEPGGRGIMATLALLKP